MGKSLIRGSYNLGKDKTFNIHNVKMGMSYIIIHFDMVCTL